MMTLIKQAGAGALSGLIAGTVVLGVGGRLIMRGIAALAHVPPGFSVGGTIEVVAFGAIVGVCAGIGYMFLRRILPGPPLLKGLLSGLIAYAALALVPPPAAQSAAAGLEHLRPQILFMFAWVFLAYGLLLAGLVSWFMKESKTEA